MDASELGVDVLLQAYSMGIFPMAESSDSADLFWVDPDDRGIFPLDQFHLSRSTIRAMRRDQITHRINHDFIGVMRACANRPNTWINADIYRLYGELNRLGFAHSLAVFKNDTMIGGVYGVSLGGAFFGETMFSSQTNGSKYALACLVARLRAGGYRLFDTQFLTPHLASLGAIEISRAAFQARLKDALKHEGDFFQLSEDTPVDEVIHLSTQTS